MLQPKNISIILADDHPLLLKGLYEELKSNEYNVLGSALNGAAALELIIQHEPNIALLDIDMPTLNGFEVVKISRQKGIRTLFILLSFHKEFDFVLQAKNLHIKGYLLKENTFLEIEKCIHAVMNGETYFSSSFNESLLSEVSEGLKKLNYLTPSEKTILKLIASMKSTNEIASILTVSERTIEKHRSNIISKLGLEKETNSLTNWSIKNRNTISEL